MGCGDFNQNQSAGGCSFAPVADIYTDAEAEEHAREVGANPRPKETISEIDERGAFIRQASQLVYLQVQHCGQQHRLQRELKIRERILLLYSLTVEITIYQVICTTKKAKNKCRC